MADTTIDAARAKAKFHRAEAEKWETYVRLHQELEREAPKHGGRREARGSSALSLVEEILGAAGNPVPVGALLEELGKRGKKLTSADPKASLSSAMSRSKRFTYVKDKGWTMAW